MLLELDLAALKAMMREAEWSGGKLFQLAVSPVGVVHFRAVDVPHKPVVVFTVEKAHDRAIASVKAAEDALSAAQKLVDLLPRKRG